MKLLFNVAGLPLSGPLHGLAWLARHIAEAAELELANPDRIQAELLALERKLEAGEIDDATHEARESELLAELETALQRSDAADHYGSAGDE